MEAPPIRAINKISYVKFIGVSLAGLCFLAYLLIAFGEHGLFFLHPSTEEISPILSSFQQKHKPLTEINFTAIYSGSDQFQILHPLLDMRQLKIQAQSPACSDENSLHLKELPTQNQIALTEEEFPGAEQSSSGKKLTKRVILERFLSDGLKLPENFLTTPPFIDEWGTSFAYLLSQNGLAPYNSKSWVEQHLSFFKVSELKDVLAKYNIDDVRFTLISKLNESEVEEIVRAEPFVLTQDYLLLKNQSRFGFSPLSYWAYDLRDLQSAIKDSKFELTILTGDSTCLLKMGNACWSYNSKHTMAYLYRYSVVIICLVGLIILILIGISVRQLYQKNREQQKNRLALQVLSHEFRTPVSAMLLMMEGLLKNQSNFEQTDQDLLTRISTEVFRLQRIIEVSKTYLQSESHRIQFKPAEISSINAWIKDFIEDCNLDIQFAPLLKDQAIVVDPFWLKFVLSSLVQNALTHGKPPISIKLENTRNKLGIAIEDKGDCYFGSLGEMTDAFVKSSRSNGMGLGLNIVKFIIDDWGSEIRFSKSPTTFTLFLKEQA